MKKKVKKTREDEVVMKMLYYFYKNNLMSRHEATEIFKRHVDVAYGKKGRKRDFILVEFPYLKAG